MTHVWHSSRAVIDEIARRTGVPAWIITGRSRHPVARAARVEAIVELRRHGYSWSEIGRALGGRHHTTVLRLMHEEGGADA